MLIDFTVENYRSIKEPVTLTTVAQSRKSVATGKESKRRNIIPDHQIAPTFTVEGRNIELLPVIGIFGANASGKSNVIKALDCFLAFIKSGSQFEKNRLDSLFVPFNLRRTTKEVPTRFELRVVQEGTIFTYTLILNRTRVLQEKLERILPLPRKMQNRLLFNRVWHREKAVYTITNGKDFGSAYREIQESLREHEPFMSLLVTRLEVEVIKPVVSWLTRRVRGVGLGLEQIEYEWTAHALQEIMPETLKLVTQIIQRFDTGIERIEIESLEKEHDKERKHFKVWVWHKADGKKFRWPMEEESIGTQRLFSLAFKILLTFEVGGLLLIDELGSNIHPNITRAIVRMFQSEKTNPKRAQLIFTSHDNTLQRGNLLRRDQIWFTQKREDGSTELYSLSDFRPRNDLAIDKAYLDGRFGAVPVLPDEEELLQPAGTTK